MYCYNTYLHNSLNKEYHVLIFLYTQVYLLSLFMKKKLFFTL